jgi:pseudaminic acid biosynthesis-associated methylase
MQFKTEQEEFWVGQFGKEYCDRNRGEHLVGSNVALFASMFARCARVNSLIEFGSNIGLNLQALRRLVPSMELDAIEINDDAVRALAEWGGANKVHHGSILDFEPARTWDVALIKGVLIHINPDCLQRVYELLYRASSRYIMVAEYYNPTPVEVVYRGHKSRLFKRDFAGEMLDRWPDLTVVDYGFVWHRDAAFPQDDLTWFVLEKSG